MSRLGLTPVKADSHSSSELLTTLLHGSVVKGEVVGRHDLRFGDYVVSLTAPGSARMPNGIECRVSIAAGARVAIGGGRLIVGRVEISPGPAWDPIPVFERFDCLPPGLEPRTDALRAWIAATVRETRTQLAGYVAGLVLLHGQRKRAERVAVRAIAQAEPATATLLRHATSGEVPEPVHDLLASRDGSRLISWSPSGISWLRGFVSAGLPLDPLSARLAPDRRTA